MPKHAYRFRGSIQPSAEVKRPVRAELTGEVDSAGAKLYLYDVIDSWGGDWGVSAREFNAALSELSGVSQITLHINSPGGEVYEGVAILNALRRHPANVTAVVDGIAASAASFIAAGSDRVVMGRNAEMMIHDAWCIAMGPAADMHAMGDQLDKVSNNIASIYAGKNGRDATAMRELMLAETWLSDQEAVDLGLADEIEGDPLDPATIENAFDLSVFRNAGRTHAPAPNLSLDDEPAAPAADGDDARDRRQRQNRNRLNLAHKRVPAVTR
jgi:ATP-dependent protease ClpP protease subunit